ncbi:polysaccharide biosynthesis tyrosine autokinase [Porticoccaceae bacterium]|nr:polysaccharide biosynthesis tyrosine autokinase [Porticoccaceae bacterium]MDA9014872.1 polysaccharide biosynthesis tyrosine autokinase [Porticoccaceae bacterium]
MSEQSGIKPSQSFSNHQAMDDEIDLRQLYGMFLDGRYIIAATVALAAIVALIYVFLATPIYKANGIIQVEDNAPGVPGLNDMAEIFASESSSATELHVIKSRLVLGRVVDELDLTVSATPNYLPIIGEVMARGTSAYDLDEPASVFTSYASGGEKLTIAELSLPNYLINQPLTLVAEGGQNYSLWLDAQVLIQSKVGVLAASKDGNVELKISELVANKGAEFELEKAGRLATILGLQRQIQVSEKGKDTGIIEISLEGADRQKIVEIVDSVSANYYLQNVQRMAAEAENSLQFLDQQIPRIQQELVKSEEALNDYRSERTSVDLSLEAQSALDSLVQIEADISTMSINEADISRRFTPQHPNYVSFKRQQSNLLGQRDKLSRKLEALPDTQKKILRLKRDFEVNQAIFLALQNKRQELSILKASTVGNVRILDKAEVMPETVAPKKALVMVLSVLLGGMLGVIIVALKHFLRAGVRDPKVFTDNGLMVHATIPHSENEESYKQQAQFFKRYKEKKNAKPEVTRSLLAADHPADLSIEALRSLRTSLHFSMLDASNHVVMLSSASPGVGKSFVTSNLAAVIAQTGQKVLIVDADMRKGYLHKRFGHSPDEGLSEVLSGTLKATAAVKSTMIDGLDVITRGNIPTNPSELLMSAQFPQMIAELESQYDLILFDTPPILAVTDASIIGTYCGASLMVARFEACTLKQVLAANQRFELNGVDIKGIIFNAVEKKASSYYYDYGYYNYEYKE